jgi:hypothetical protein
MRAIWAAKNHEQQPRNLFRNKLFAFEQSNPDSEQLNAATFFVLDDFFQWH